MWLYPLLDISITNQNTIFNTNLWQKQLLLFFHFFKRGKLNAKKTLTSQ